MQPLPAAVALAGTCLGPVMKAASGLVLLSHKNPTWCIYVDSNRKM
jgi:hypothetical protein